MDNEMKVFEVPVNELRAAEYNPRAMNAKEAGDLKASLDTFGMVEPIVVNSAPSRKNVIIGGHQRYNIWKLSHTSIPVVFVFIEDLVKEQELNIRLNKNNGHWDFDLLANFDEEILKMSGFDSSELDRIFKKDIAQDEPPDLPENANSKPGQVYVLGKHRLMCGDATSREDVEKLMGGGRADMVFTDPPYNVEYTGHRKIRNEIENDKMSGDDYFVFLEEAFLNLSEHTKPGGAIYVCHADTETVNVRTAFKEAGFHLSTVLIWNKNSMVISRQDYHWKHEPILYGWKEGGSHKFYGENNQTTVWDIDRPSRSAEHPTMKPTELIARCLLNSSVQGEIVLDLFGGAGSTLAAAEQANRACYIMEIDPRYCDVIRKRYAKLVNKEDQWASL